MPKAPTLRGYVHLVDYRLQDHLKATMSPTSMNTGWVSNEQY